LFNCTNHKLHRDYSKDMRGAHVTDVAEIRAIERDAIRACLVEYEPFLELPRVAQDSLVKLLEISCNNATYDRCVMRNIPQIWDDRYIEIYSGIGYNLKINLDIGSSVNRGVSRDVSSYLASRLVAWMTSRYVRIAGRIWDSDIPWDLILSYIPSINPRMCAYLDGLEINPSRSQKYLDEISLREQQKIDKKFTTQYPCPQCGVRRATFKSVQSRGLDEDNTLYILCDSCGHTWRRN
jgi:DNA-directed RNA polymerase subunit M/transcription elongation factor TFIIS